jgi:hypothetical protein
MPILEVLRGHEEVFSGFLTLEYTTIRLGRAGVDRPDYMRKFRSETLVSRMVSKSETDLKGCEIGSSRVSGSWR